MESEDYDVTLAMVKFGGSFVEALGRAAQAADDLNLARIKNAFPEVWAQYLNMATLDRERRAKAVKVGP